MAHPVSASHTAKLDFPTGAVLTFNMLETIGSMLKCAGPYQFYTMVKRRFLLEKSFEENFARQNFFIKVSSQRHLSNY